MFPSFRKASPLTKAALIAAGSALSILLFQAIPSRAQQPTAPAHRHRGGGFTQPEPIDFNDHAGWTSMFDGSTLNGWDGDTKYWRVEDGAITVESTCEKPTGTIYLVWKGGEPADFEMKLEMRGEGAQVNSGIQYRGAILSPSEAHRGPGGGPQPTGVCPGGQPRGVPPSKASQAKWDMLGAQFDFDGRNQYTGQYYEQATGRGIIAWRGQVVHTEEGKKPRLVATLGDPKGLGGYVNVDGWNQLHLIARGHEMIHIVNGHAMAILMDDDATKFRKSGLIGFEIEGTGKISIRDVWIKKL
jgi:hypothetical protein